MKDRVDYSLYLVTDQRYTEKEFFMNVIQEAIIGGVTLIQLREKNLNSLEFYKIAKEVKELTSKYKIPLIINDRVDIALAVDAEGVHVGQKDIPANKVRTLLGKDKILGVSAATIDEALKAQEDGADYIGVGALFPTATKVDTRKVSLEELGFIKKKVNIPVVGIGGINEGNISALKDTGIDGVAVVSAILAASNVKARAKKLARYFNKK